MSTYWDGTLSIACRIMRPPIPATRAQNHHCAKMILRSGSSQGTHSTQADLVIWPSGDRAISDNADSWLRPGLPQKTGQDSFDTLGQSPSTSLGAAAKTG
jgi:hypothetical protein